MGRVTTNSINVAYAIQSGLGGVLPGSPLWKNLEPNGIGSFGTTVAKTARDPISKARQRRKGIVTDLDSNVELDVDVTMDHLKDFIEGFCFARAIGPDILLPTAVTATDYTVPAISAGTAGRLVYNASGPTSLLYARGFVIAGNNGLKLLGAAEATSSTAITVSGLAPETIAATQEVELAIAGVRGAAGDFEIDADGNLISTTLDFRVLGLTPGQTIHVGGIDEANRFFEPDNFGFVRVDVIEQNKLTLSFPDQPFVLDDGTDTGSGGAGIQIDLLFGQFVRNVDVGATDYIERLYQFEVTSPGLGPASETRYEYSIDNMANTLTMELPLNDKATMTLGFVGSDTLIPTGSRATGADNAKVPNETGAFGTSSDIARLRIMDIDEQGLSTDFKSLTLSITNNVEGEKVLAKLGPRYLNAGNFEADVESQMLFTNEEVIERIRCNKTLHIDFALRNADGGVHFEIPSLTLGGGDREYPANQSVAINTTAEAYRDETFGVSLAVSFFPALPQTGCP